MIRYNSMVTLVDNWLILASFRTAAVMSCHQIAPKSDSHISLVVCITHIAGESASEPARQAVMRLFGGASFGKTELLCIIMDFAVNHGIRRGEHVPLAPRIPISMPLGAQMPADYCVTPETKTCRQLVHDRIELSIYTYIEREQESESDLQQRLIL